MGEYIKRGKQQVKIGTCENLYYTTHRELKRLHNLKSVNATNFMNENSYRFRFPFPDEDDKKLWGVYQDFNRGELFRFPKLKGVELAHGDVFFRSDYGNKKAIPAYGFNQPCIFQEQTIKIYDWDNIKDSLIFEVTQQKIVGGILETVVRCPYCGEICRLSFDEVKILTHYVWEHKSYFTDIQKQIIVLMYKGYKTKSI